MPMPRSYLSWAAGTASAILCASIPHNASGPGGHRPGEESALRSCAPPIRVIRGLEQAPRTLRQAAIPSGGDLRDFLQPSGLPPPAIRPAVAPAPLETGIASWYGEPFHGRMAASGEIYDMEQLTAAHRTLPFGTLVRVRRLDTAQAVLVRINDRGPFVDSRIIDLSNAAARQIGMTVPGIVEVALEVVSAGVDIHGGIFAVQVGAFRELANARRALALMEQRYGSARMVLRHRDEDLWTVLAGEAHSETEAATLVAAIRAQEPHAFMVRVDDSAAQ